MRDALRFAEGFAGPARRHDMLHRPHVTSTTKWPAAPLGAEGPTPSVAAAPTLDAGGASRLEGILEVVPLAIALFDDHLALVRANARFYELLGREPGRIGVDTLPTLFPDWPVDLGAPADLIGHAGARRPVRFALRHGASADDAADGAAGGEARVVEATLTPVPARGGLPRALCFVGRDVTPEAATASAETADAARLHHLVELRTQELLHLQDARARERRLAAVGQLAAGVMHDVNNALNPIMAAAHLILLDPTDAEAVRDYATRIAKAAETGAATAARVGRFIRQEPQAASHEELIDLSVTADEVIAMTRPVWGARALGGEIELRRAVADGALTRGLPAEIREALINLVQNSLDAMAGVGGTLGVVTRVENGEAIVEVSDTGHGMTPDVCERAFEPFFTTKGVMGTGLGLSEVYGIVKRHRGRAELASTPGVGTTVRLAFPLATALTPSGEFHAFLDRVPKRVLVVDGDPSSRDVVCALLVADGHVVDAATSAAEALMRLDATLARYARYDLLLVSPVLPDAGGCAVVDAVRARWRDIRVGMVGAAEEGAAAGAPVRADFTIVKPVRATQLLSLAAADG